MLSSQLLGADGHMHAFHVVSDPLWAGSLWPGCSEPRPPASFPTDSRLSFQRLRHLCLLLKTLFFSSLFFKRLLCHNYSEKGFAPVGNINRLLWGPTTNFSTHIICLCMVIKLQQYFMQCFPAKLIWALLFWLLLFCPQALKLNWIFIIIAFCCSSAYLFSFFQFLYQRSNKDIKKQH